MRKQGHPWKHAGIAMAIGALSYLWPLRIVAEEPRYYKIEAAFLYNFFNYITWPGYTSPEALTQPVICIESNDPVGPYLAYVQHKMLGQRGLQVRKVMDNGSLAGCHLLFVRHAVSETGVRDALKNNTLIVAEPEDPLDRGAPLDLVKEEERLTLDIDQSRLTAGGFQISSRLLDLAERVR